MTPKSSKRKKYVCIGGVIDSKNDGDRHYISPVRIAQLYKVNFDECYFANDEDSDLLKALRLEELIILRPRYNGDYTMPTSKND